MLFMAQENKHRRFCTAVLESDAPDENSVLEQQRKLSSDIWTKASIL